MSYIRLEFPYPPSVNGYWRRVANRTVLSRQARDYRKKVRFLWFCHRTLHPHRELAKASVAVRVVAFPPDRRRRDLDNLLKAVLDAIEAAGIIQDDAQVRRLEVEWGAPVSGGSVVLTITEFEEDHGNDASSAP